MRIERFSSTYINNKDNFVIISEGDNEVKAETRENSLFSIYCIVKNIIQRGNPTRLSNYLEETIGELPSEEVCLISNQNNKWGSFIKGDEENNDYPARFFYEECLSAALGKEYGFVKNLILPEAKFEDILDSSTPFKGQSVDFYLHQAHLVIEIDGSSHNESAQKAKDYERDLELKKHGIRTVRIKASDIKEKNANLNYEFKRIGRIVSSSNLINRYKDAVEKPLTKKIEDAETIMRLQMALLSSLLNKNLDIRKKEWRISLRSSDIKELDNLLRIAYQDLQLWIAAVSGLAGLKIDYPQIIIGSDLDEADLVIDYSLYRRYDEDCMPSSKTIFVRTDYYREHNHFKVSVGNPINYKLDLRNNDKDRLNLMFLLQNIFGHDEFRDGQEQIIENVLNGNNTIGVLPTGTGKSVCYQLPALLQPGVTIIVDPIISLMMDQKRSLEENYGITHNNYIASNQGGNTKEQILDDFRNGRFQMLWISPERFQSRAFRNGLSSINSKLNFSLAVIDEVHCLSEWGHDFRISYLTLTKTLRKYCPNAVLLGLTATASEFVLKDIQAEFGLNKPLDYKNVIASYSMDRDELSFIRIAVNGDSERNNYVRIIVAEENRPGAQGLLFCKTIYSSETQLNNRSSCADMKDVLRGIDKQEEPRLFYGKMDDRKKEETQRAFMHGEFPLMICTKAFGMGIDNPNIRYTIHNSLPSSVESFYQEAGRAGRDGNDAKCYVLYHVDDKARKTVEEFAAEDNLLDILNNSAELKDCDLGTTVFFFNQNRKSEDAEVESISEVFKDLLKHTIIEFNNKEKGKSKQSLEQAIYKLSILGIVKDWTVEYQNILKGSCIVQLESPKEITYENAINHFLKYVRKYDPEFDFGNKENEEYAAILKEEDVESAIRLIVKWTNNNILYNRVMCTKTMMDLCSESVSDEEFRRTIDAYFRTSEETTSLKLIADNPKSWEEWFKIFFHRDKRKNDVVMIDREEIKDNHASLQRFLESYKNNTGLNYLDGLFQLLYKDQIEETDLSRMKRSIETIRQMDEEEQENIVRSTLEVAATINNQGTIITLSKLMIDSFPKLSRIVYEYLHDNYSLMIELEKEVERIGAIKWIT